MYAEIKALCTGDPRIKEKMDLDIDVGRLKLLKASHLSQKYSLEDQIIREFPQKIAALEQRIEGYKLDIAHAEKNTVPDITINFFLLAPFGAVSSLVSICRKGRIMQFIK